MPQLSQNSRMSWLKRRIEKISGIVVVVVKMLEKILGFKSS